MGRKRWSSGGTSWLRYGGAGAGVEVVQRRALQGGGGFLVYRRGKGKDGERGWKDEEVAQRIQAGAGGASAGWVAEV